jgi:flagellar basal body-associated protein FliL
MAAEVKMDKPKAKRSGKSGVLAKIILILIVVVIILGGLYFVDKYTKINIFGIDDSERLR